ncbi:ATP-binding protein [Acidovorax kalamii]|jgi:ABC-type multidrug transport system fused ATPase/permease subunit|uniref:ATP-binding protein n=1 Tax=Acidovorax kalamii TaxID=2004485 RepID=UPI002090F33E|nr:ATP-binding protein [Acidovorax kalamii]MCO5356465.1 ATP-binding protein [Acidovorax kalamii]
MHINPDHFLQTDRGRVFTPERNRHAWANSYSALERTLGETARPATVYLLVGPQGAGKSTWVKNRPLAEGAVYFDAILVKRSERAEILSRIKPFGAQVIAVWLQTSLLACLERNAARPADEAVNEKALRNVYAALEAPSLSEGFDAIIEVPHDRLPGTVLRS